MTTEGERGTAFATRARVGEMAYVAPSPELRLHSANVVVVEAGMARPSPSRRKALAQLSPGGRHRFDEAFIRVLVRRRLHAAHEALAHPRRIL